MNKEEKTGRDESDWSNIKLKKSTINRLKSHGEIGDTYNDAIERLLEESNKEKEVRLAFRRDLKKEIREAKK